MSTNEDLLHCPICLELYRKPRALPCLHTFCQDCLQDFINTSLRSKQAAGGFECPVCRRHIQPTTTSPHTKWAETFEMNYIIVTLLDNHKGAETRNVEKEESSRDRGAVRTEASTAGVVNEHIPGNIDYHPEKGSEAGDVEHFHPPPPHWPRPHHPPWHHPPHHFPPNHHGPHPREFPPPPPHLCHPPRCHGGRFRHPHGPPRHHGPHHHPHHPPPWAPPRGPPPGPQ